MQIAEELKKGAGKIPRGNGGKKKGSNRVMLKIAGFIVKARYVIMVLFVLLMVFCVWGWGQVEIEYEISAYLSEDTDTKKALDIMEEEFTTYATSTILIKNVTYKEAHALYEEISEYDGVKSFTFENTPDYYSQSSALFEITYDGDEDAEITEEAYYKVLERLEDYDTYVSVAAVDTLAEELQTEVMYALVFAVLVIIAVLLFTSKSYAEVLVFLCTFAVAAVFNMGTNFLFGTISFISNSVCVILQLALAIDYAIILCHRFAEEKELCGGDSITAMTNALSKAIVEISSSSLTTIAGLLALTTMSLGLGADLGLVLAKSILCSMITVFLFMPGLTILFSKPIDRTTHRNFVPGISAVGRFDVKARYVIAAVFLALAGCGAYFSFNITYSYDTDSIDTNSPTDTMVAIAEVEEIFGYQNQFVVIVPGHDYEEQLEILETIESYAEISEGLGICNQELTMNGYTHTLTEQMNYRDFSAFLGIGETAGDAVYAAYAYLSGDTTDDGLRETALYEVNKLAYTASLLEICDCAFDNDDFITAYLGSDEDALDTYEELRDTVQDAEDQLIGENYTRMLFEMDLPTESAETFAFLGTLIDEVKAEYPDVIFAGNSMSAYDLNESFSTDNLKVTLLTLLFVYIILLFAFRSWGLPIPLVATIEGAIFLNFSWYYFTGMNVYFFVYLIVSAIQMGATIDYAIVLTNRYYAARREGREKKDAVVTAVNGAFPTIITSGTIMTVAAFLIGALVSNQLIATLGNCLGRGVIISVVLVLFVLPALLAICEKPVSKTFFKKGFLRRFLGLGHRAEGAAEESARAEGAAEGAGAAEDVSGAREGPPPETDAAEKDAEDGAARRAETDEGRNAE